MEIKDWASKNFGFITPNEITQEIYEAFWEEK
jgi:hypothetical protein